MKNLNGRLRNVHLFKRRIFIATLFEDCGEKTKVALCPVIDQWLKHDTTMLQNFETHAIDLYVLTRKKQLRHIIKASHRVLCKVSPYLFLF